MSRKQFTVEAIVRMRREAEVELASGSNVKYVAKKLGINEQTYYPVAERVRWSQDRSGSPAEGTGTGERPVEEAGWGAGSGYLDPQGGSFGKLISPARRRLAVERVRRKLGV